VLCDCERGWELSKRGLLRRDFGGGGGVLLDSIGDSDSSPVVLTPRNAIGLDGRGGGALVVGSGTDFLLGDFEASNVEADRGMTWRCDS